MQRVAGIWLPTGDTHFPEALRKSEKVDGKGTYQLNKQRAALAMVPGDRRGLALDIGAHVGLWTRYLAKQFRQVHAFEPVPEHIECLEDNTRGLRGITIYAAVALGQHTIGHHYINRTASNSGNAHVARAPANGACGVVARTLDSYSFSGVDFIKVDVEGYEHFVLLGGEETIRRCKPVLVVEQKPGNAERYGIKTGMAIDLLKSWGASVQWMKSGDYCLIWK